MWLNDSLASHELVMHYYFESERVFGKFGTAPAVFLRGVAAYEWLLAR